MAKEALENKTKQKKTLHQHKEKKSFLFSSEFALVSLLLARVII